MIRFVSVAALLLLAACGGGRSPYGGTDRPTGVKLGKPYSVMGQYYEPRYDPAYTEEGVASWYGPGFDGRMTASGERFNTKDLTAAHRTLPMPSLVRVTRLKTGKSIIARVNDRGPFKRDRIIDISSAAADALGIKGVGSDRVRVEYLPEATEKYLADIGIAKPNWMTSPQAIERQYATIAASTGIATNPAKGPSYAPGASTSPLDPNLPVQAAPTFAVTVSNPSYYETSGAPKGAVGLSNAAGRTSHFSLRIPSESGTATATPGGKYFVQTATFGTEQNARNQATRIASIAPAEVRGVERDDRQLYRVLLGPFGTADEAKLTLERAKGMGFTDARIMIP